MKKWIWAVLPAILLMLVPASSWAHDRGYDDDNYNNGRGGYHQSYYNQGRGSFHRCKGNNNYNQGNGWWRNSRNRGYMSNGWNGNPAGQFRQSNRHNLRWW